jgi:asparagine synthase (glutamine-hydrolysing)
MRDAAPLIDLESFLPHNLLQYGDRMSMAHALEVRVPFCDRKVVEKLAPLPIEKKMPAGVQKGLFRWAMRKDLPNGVITHRKVGFNPPIQAWLRRDLSRILDDYLGDKAVRERGLFRPAEVSRLRRGFAEGQLDVGHTLWSLIILEAWLRWLPSSAEHT